MRFFFGDLWIAVIECYVAQMDDVFPENILLLDKQKFEEVANERGGHRRQKCVFK